jgi:amino acid transporter
MITSVLGASLACQNVATRMWYSMGRAGVLPKSFGKVHPTRRTPTTAVTAQWILSVILGIGGPLVLGGPWPFFIFLIAFVLVLGVIFVYIAANIGVVVYFSTRARDEFNVIKHVIFPVGTSLVLLYSIYAAFVPLPAPPNNWTPLVALAWLAIGIVILFVMKASGKQEWLTKAAAIVAEREDTERHHPL